MALTTVLIPISAKIGPGKAIAGVEDCGLARSQGKWHVGEAREVGEEAGLLVSYFFGFAYPDQK